MRNILANLTLHIIFLVIVGSTHSAIAEEPRNYALLIAVTKYQHPELNKPLLAYPEVDAQSVGQFLQQHGYEVEYLLGSAASKKNIELKLAELNRKGNSDGSLLLGLWGHGVEFEGTKETMFCPYDALPRFAVDADNKQLFDRQGQKLLEPDPSTLVGMSAVLDGMRISGAGNRILVADCCRTSPNRARGRAFGANVSQTDIPDNTLALFACKADQQAFEHDEWGHGAMTKGLLESLPSLVGSEDGYAISMIAPMTTNVSKLVRSVSNGRDQQTIHPILNGNPVLRLKSTESPKTIVNGIGATMVLIPAGTFLMGSPESDTEADPDEMPQRQVTLTRSFYMGATEVTQGQWKSVMGTEPWKGESYVREGANYPATYVSWDDAVEYCRRLSDREGREYRLPTEAEWEYACRGGTNTKYSFGDDSTSLSRYAWFSDNADAIFERYAHLVQQKLANPFGLYDMHGNVWEWCSDRTGGYTAGAATDLEVAFDGEARVFRGGSWDFTSGHCRSASRRRFTPANRFNDLGFRLVSVSE